MFNPAPSYQSKLLIKIAQSGRGRGHAAGGTTVASRAGAMPCEYRTPTPGVRPASVPAIGLLPRHTTPLRRGPGCDARGTADCGFKSQERSSSREIDGLD